MASQPRSSLPVGQVLEISFATFTPRITIHSERKLTVEIIAGDNIGFSDTVEYEAVAVRDGLVILSWQEHIGSTIVHVLDLSSCKAYTAGLCDSRVGLKSNLKRDGILGSRAAAGPWLIFAHLPSAFRTAQIATSIYEVVHEAGGVPAAAASG
jgi:hypothetical protein